MEILMTEQELNSFFPVRVGENWSRYKTRLLKESKKMVNYLKQDSSCTGKYELFVAYRLPTVLHKIGLTK